MSGQPQSAWRVWITRRPHLLLVIVALILFLAACLSPTLDLVTRSVPHSHTTDYGYDDLIIGWLGVFFGLVAWFANPCLILALFFLLIHRPRAADVFSLLALLFSLDMLGFDAAHVATDEGGTDTYLLGSLLIGAYLWYACLIVTFAGSLWLSLRPPRTAPG
jgi:hypothetical protein